MPASSRNAWLGLAALVALLAYIVACASFSPDDSKVLFPAFDPASGQLGIALYDRTAARSEILLTVGPGKMSHENNALRAQFIGDGRQVVAAWLQEADGSAEPTLQILVLGSAARLPVRAHTFPIHDDAGSQLVYPLALSGQRLFFSTSKTNFIDLDLLNGSFQTRTNATHEMLCFFPGDRGQVFYMSQQNHSLDWGRVNLASLALERTGTMPDGPNCLAFDLARSRFLFQDEQDDKARLTLVEAGKTNAVLEISRAGVRFGVGTFRPDGRTVVAACTREIPGRRTVAIMELALQAGAAPRFTTLFQTKSTIDEGLLQLGLSHDGATAAFVSTPIAEDLDRAEDCGLFLVDLKDPKRKVTRVSLPPKPAPGE